MFQSTHPHRVRPIAFSVEDLALLFQSTHPHRVRHLINRRKGIVYCFNPRTHIGCDYESRSASTSAFSFNPRTHIGCDLSVSLCHNYYRFQSTHPHRVRQNFLFSDTILTPFQSTHPHRVRQNFLFSDTILKPFQSTHPHRVRRCAAKKLLLSVSFNPRTHIGCDLNRRETLRESSVSIHAPT